MRKLYRRFIPVLVCFIYLLPAVAHADLLGFWLRPKVDYVSGTGDIFQRFAGQPAYGGELGLELLGITVWADAELMTEDQYWMSGNVGYDLSFGSDIKLTLGVYGGVIAFKFPPQEKESITRNDELDAILDGLMINADDFIDQYEDLVDAESQVADMAFGLNARGRMVLEYFFAPSLSVGLQGSAAYHLIISGEEAAGEAKSKAVDLAVTQATAGQNLPASAVDKATKDLKKALGIKEVNVDDLKGINYSVGAFIGLSF